MTLNKTNHDWLLYMSVRWPLGGPSPMKAAMESSYGVPSAISLKVWLHVTTANTTFQIKTSLWGSILRIIRACKAKTVNKGVVRRIWAIYWVVCHILDALLNPNSLLVQFMFPPVKILQFQLKIYQLVCNFTRVATWTNTPSDEQK